MITGMKVKISENRRIIPNDHYTWRLERTLFEPNVWTYYILLQPSKCRCLKPCSKMDDILDVIEDSCPFRADTGRWKSACVPTSRDCKTRKSQGPRSSNLSPQSLRNVNDAICTHPDEAQGKAFELQAWHAKLYGATNLQSTLISRVSPSAHQFAVSSQSFRFQWLPYTHPSEPRLG